MQNYFWSSSSYSANTISAWGVYLVPGNTMSNNDKNNSTYVVCVR